MQAYQAIQRIFPSPLRDGVRDLADAVFANQRGSRHASSAADPVVEDEYAFSAAGYPRTASQRYPAVGVEQRLPAVVR
jgi:hypothetical protein